MKAHLDTNTISGAFLRDMLLLTGITIPPAVIIEDWTPAQRHEAAMWAAAEHLHASDNDDVERLPKPSFLGSACTFCKEYITLLGGSWTTDDGTTACTDTSAPYVPHKPEEN